MKINDYFNDFNKALKSDAFKSFKSHLAELKLGLRSVSEEDYDSMFENITSGDMSKKFKEAIAQTKIESPQLAKIEESIYEAIQQCLLDRMLESFKSFWNDDIASQISLVKQEYPLYSRSNIMFDAEAFKLVFGKDSLMYSKLESQISPFIKINSSGDWVIKSIVTGNQRKVLKKYLKDFIIIYKLQHLLWDKNGDPKPIEFELSSPELFESTNKSKELLHFFNIGLQRYIGMNTQISAKQKLNYDWSVAPSITIGWLSEKKENYQKEFNGEFALLKAISEAKCDRKTHKCVWKIGSDKDDSAIKNVSFTIKSSIFNISENEGYSNESF